MAALARRLSGSEGSEAMSPIPIIASNSADEYMVDRENPEARMAVESMANVPEASSLSPQRSVALRRRRGTVMAAPRL